MNKFYGTGMLFTSTYLSQHARKDSEKPNECAALTPEQEAAELQKLMEQEGGNMDPEEMQEHIKKLRGDKSVRPPEF